MYISKKVWQGLNYFLFFYDNVTMLYFSLNPKKKKKIIVPNVDIIISVTLLSNYACLYKQNLKTTYKIIKSRSSLFVRSSSKM